MNIRDTLKTLFAPPTVTVPGDVDRMVVQMGRFGHFHRVDDDALSGRAARLAVVSAWAHSDIRLIADRVSSKKSQIEVHDGTSGEAVSSHPFYELQKRPNAFMSWPFLLRYLTWWYWIRGNAYIFISTPSIGKGKPTELWPLASDMVRPLSEYMREGVGLFRGRQMIDYEYNVNGTLERLPGENIIHIRTPNPFDYWEGLSPLVAGLLPIEMDISQAAWVRDFFKEDNAIPSAIISVPASTSPADFDRQKALFRQQMSEGQRRIFSRSGDLTVEKLTQTLEQMEIIQSRKFSQEEIDRVFGVPSGLYNSPSGDSRTAAEVGFTRDTIQPMIDLIADQFTADLMPFYSNTQIFCAPNVIPQDRALAVQEYTIFSQDKTVNENRQEQNLEPIEDEYGLADIPVRLLQYLAPGLTAPETGETTPDQTTEETQDVGSMVEAQDPEAMVEELSGRSARDRRVSQELRAWRKIALRELREGRSPGGRPFGSTIIPRDRHDLIVRRLQIAQDESEVKAAFESVPFREWDSSMEADWELYTP